MTADLQEFHNKSGVYPTVAIITLGCPKNHVDSQTLASNLRTAGFELVTWQDYADVVLVNTCAFIREAKRESDAVIRSVCSKKKKGLCKRVIVTGCLPQRFPKRVQTDHLSVDAFVGIDAIDRIGDITWHVLSDAHRSALVDIPCRPVKLHGHYQPGVIFSTGAHAYLKIADGCRYRCSFCAIPRIRGPHRSRSIFDLQKETAFLVNRGFREITLVSQDVTSYGCEQDGEQSLADLLKALDNMEGNFWLRIMYAHPAGIRTSLLETMASLKHVVHYLDVPIQHVHPDVLSKMGRAAGINMIRRLPQMARSIIPDIALRTTCLVGHPGEDEEAFKQLLDFIAEAKFDHLGVFTYSPEEGTRSANLAGRPSSAISRARRDRLLEVQTLIMREKQRALVNKHAVVLTEKRISENPAIWKARSYMQAPDIDGCVLIHKVSPKTMIGDFLKVRYTNFKGCDMVAEVFNDKEEFQCLRTGK